MEQKHCKRCDQTRPVSEFGRCRSTKDGLQSWCKPCKHANYVANAEHWNDRQKERLAEDPEKERARGLAAFRRWYTKPGNRQKHRQYYWKDPEAKKAYVRQYYQQHREECAARARAYNERKPEVPRQASRRRKARKRNAAGVVSLSQLAQRFALWGERCWLCGGSPEQDDHVKPLAKGGSDWPANHRPICAPCNQGKRDRWPLPSLLGIGFPRPQLPPKPASPEVAG